MLAKPAEKATLSPSRNEKFIAIKNEFFRAHGQVWGNGIAASPPHYWESKDNRIKWVKLLVECIEKDPRRLVKRDFLDNGLSYLIKEYHFSPFLAASEAYPEIVQTKSDVAAPRFIYFTHEERRAALLSVATAEAKIHGMTIRNAISSLSQSIFKQYGKIRLCDIYSGSISKMVKDLFPDLKMKPWEFLATPKFYFNSKENRVAAVRWLCEERLCKYPRYLTKADFEDNCLSGLLRNHYQNIVFLAISEAYPDILQSDLGYWKGALQAGREQVNVVSMHMARVGSNSYAGGENDSARRALACLLRNAYGRYVYGRISALFPNIGLPAWPTARAQMQAPSANQELPGGVSQEKDAVALDESVHAGQAPKAQQKAGATGNGALPQTKGKKPGEAYSPEMGGASDDDILAELALLEEEPSEKKNRKKKGLPIPQSASMASSKHDDLQVEIAKQHLRYCRESLRVLSDKAKISITTSYGRTIFMWESFSPGMPTLALSLNVSEQKGHYTYKDTHVGFSLSDLEAVLGKIRSLSLQVK